MTHGSGPKDHSSELENLGPIFDVSLIFLLEMVTGLPSRKDI